MKRATTKCVKQIADKQWWVPQNRGESPHKTLGLSRDEERGAEYFCTLKRAIRDCFPELLNDGAGMPPLVRDVIEHIKEDWPQLTPDERERIIADLSDPRLSPPPGFSNFPHDPKRQRAASLIRVTPPDPARVHGTKFTFASEAMMEECLAVGGNGWITVHINARYKEALKVAAGIIRDMPTTERESEFEWDIRPEEAKAKAAKDGSATATVRKQPARRIGFDDWTQQVAEYDKSKKPFPLLTAIIEQLKSLKAAAASGVPR